MEIIGLVTTNCKILQHRLHECTTYNELITEASKKFCKIPKKDLIRDVLEHTWCRLYGVYEIYKKYRRYKYNKYMDVIFNENEIGYNFIIKFEILSYNTVIIPSIIDKISIPIEISINIEFLCRWFNNIVSENCKPGDVTKEFSVNIRNYLNGKRIDYDFDFSTIPVDRYLSKEEFNYYCTLASINIEYIKNPYVSSTFHFYD
jgi:hypothetical protein